MARSFTSSEAKQLKSFFGQISADMAAETSSVQELRQTLPKLIDDALAAKIGDAVTGEYIDVIAHDGKGELAAKLRKQGCSTIGDAQAYYSENPGNRWAFGTRSESRFINNAAETYPSYLAAVTRLALDEDDPTPELNQLVLSTYRYREALTTLSECHAFTQSYKADVDEALGKLQRGTRNNFTWLFVSQEGQDAAEEAYSYLYSLKNGSYGATISTCFNTLKGLRTASEATAWASYRQMPDKFIEFLNKVAPDKVCRSEAELASLNPRPFTGDEAHELVDSAEVAVETLTQIVKTYSEEKLENAVRGTANNMVASDAMEILRGISVDELNRDKRGIRVNLLKGAGYMNLADLAHATVDELAEIKGISEESGLAIKHAFSEIANSVYRTTKIRLSTDRKTEASTAVVLATHHYINHRELAQKSGELYGGYADPITENVNVLRRSGGELGWLMASGAEREEAQQAYAYLSGLTDTSFDKAARDVFKTYRAIVGNSAEDAWDDFAKRPVAYINALETIVPDLVGTGGDYGLPEELAKEIQEQPFYPEGLLCTLRRYQEVGVKYILHQEKVLLGDEMGLGKTVQAIAVMVSLRNCGETHFFVVCPASVLTNWCREVKKMSDLSPIKIHGSGRDAALARWFEEGGVAVTTYETISRLEIPEDYRFGMLTVDEAHYVKNPDAQRSRSVKELCKHSDRLLFMTGTALENRVEEMVRLIDMLQPEVAKKVRGIESLATAPFFREFVAPVYFRRKREDVLTELPDKEEIVEWCDLGPEEEAAYEEALFSKNYMAIRRVSWNVDDIAQSSKARRLVELVDEAGEEGRKILVFTFFRDTLEKVVAVLGERCLEPIHGGISPQRRQEIIDEFDEAPAGTVLAAQIIAGGTGLNIQSASVVVICEPQLKPSTESQAISRAYRMGQTRKVMVYRLLADETIDERIIDLLAQKQQIFDAFADKSVAAQESIELDDATLGQLVEEEIERIKREKSLTDEADTEPEAAAEEEAAEPEAAADSVV